MSQRPRALLFGYGGTLVEESEFNPRAGIEVLLRAADPPPTAALGVILVPPAEIWFIGDRLDTDVAGARAAGMTPFLFRPEPIADRADGGLLAATWPDLVRHFRDAAQRL